jgi:2-polyprenyl-6-methoxyphenol hydroxylase-like FAD-dependent oxidoreductase
VVDAKRWGDRVRTEPLQQCYDSLISRCAPVAQLLRGARQVAPVRAIRDYSYSSDRFHSGGTLLAGDAACFIDPVFSTGVHLACLAGVLAADTVEDALDGRRARDEAFARYDETYRRSFERYREFVAFFYNHHAAADSYFWCARKLVDPAAALSPREAFVRLIAGTGDLDGVADVRRVDERWRTSLAAGQPRGAPGMHLMRVAATLAQLRALNQT